MRLEDSRTQTSVPQELTGSVMPRRVAMMGGCENTMAQAISGCVRVISGVAGQHSRCTTTISEASIFVDIILNRRILLDEEASQQPREHGS